MINLKNYKRVTSQKYEAIELLKKLENLKVGIIIPKWRKRKKRNLVFGESRGSKI